MRIALVAESYYPQLGGIPEHVHHLAVELNGRGHDTIVITARMGDHSDAPFVRRVGRSVAKVILAADPKDTYVVRWARYLSASVRGFPDETSINVIKSHGARYLVIHGEWLFGARYDELIADLDRRPDLRLVSRRPWQREGKHAEISVYRVRHIESTDLRN